MDAPLLDHVSLAAEEAEIERMGFAITPTPGTAGHTRVFLDRTYLEVTPPRDGELAARGWLLRVADLEKAANALRAAGLRTRGPERYQGADGAWLDLGLADRGSTVLPIVTRRLDRPAGTWPPPLERAHPNGAIRLAAVHLRIEDPAPLVAMLGALGAESEGAGGFRLGGGGRLAIDLAERRPEGIVALSLDRAEAPALTLNVDRAGERWRPPPPQAT